MLINEIFKEKINSWTSQPVDTLKLFQSVKFTFNLRRQVGRAFAEGKIQAAFTDQVSTMLEVAREEIFESELRAQSLNPVQ